MTILRAKCVKQPLYTGRHYAILGSGGRVVRARAIRCVHCGDIHSPIVQHNGSRLAPLRANLDLQ